MPRLGAILMAALLSIAGTPRAADAASVLAMYPVGHLPFAVVSDPIDGRLYVANSGTVTPSGTGTISVVDPASGSVRSLVTSKPSALLALDSAARRLYSSNYDPSNDSVSFDVLDIGSGSIVATLPVGGLGVALDPASSRAFVADGRTVVAVDITTFTVVATRSAPLGELWFGVAVDPSLHHLYLTNIDNANPSLVVLDTRDLSLVGEISLVTVPRFAITVDVTTQRVFVAGSDPLGPPFAGSTLYAIAGSTLAVTASVSLPGFPGGIAFSAETQSLWVTDLHSNAVVGLDAETLGVTTPAVPLTWQPALATFGIDGRLYVSAHSMDSLAAVDTAQRNMEPVIDRVTVSPPEAKTNDVLTAVVSAHDPDGDPVTLSYQWSVNKIPVAGETGPSIDLSTSGNGDRDDFICLTVTASDGELESSVFGCFLQLQDSAPAVAVILDTTTPTTNAILSASANGSDADGDALTYTFTWKVNGVTRSTTTGSSASASFDLALAGNGDKGQTVSVEVVASDGLLQSGTASASVIVANAPPTVTVSLSDATPQTRDVLVATASAQDADADPLTLTYTWSVNGVVKQTGASNSFDLGVKGQGDNGDVITVTATASDGTASATATASATVTPGRKH